MTPEEARSLFLPVHGVVGVLALVGGFGALLTKKGSTVHRRAGLLFVGAMALAIVAATPVLVVTRNLFLTCMGSFAAYMTWTGFRLARKKNAAGTPADRGASVAMIVVGVGFALFGLRALVAGNTDGIIGIGMGLGSALFARFHLRWYAADRSTRRPWVAMHLGAAGGGLIAGLTAFGAAAVTNWLPDLPEYIVWLGPTVVLSPLLQRWGRQVARAA